MQLVVRALDRARQERVLLTRAATGPMMTFAHTSLRIQIPAVVDELRLLVVDLAELAEVVPGSLDAWELDESFEVWLERRWFGLRFG